MKLCILCRTRPAAVPDRESMGRPIKKVCVECHGERLQGDLEKILRPKPSETPRDEKKERHH